MPKLTKDNSRSTQDALPTFVLGTLLDGIAEFEADADGDGSVSLSELQEYVREEVIELTDGRQQPTFRLQNITNDWHIVNR